MLWNSRHVWDSCAQPLGTSNASMHFCKSRKHICSCGAEPAGMSVSLVSDPQLCLLCVSPTNGLVSTIAPDHHACMLQKHLTSSHVLICRIQSACMPRTVCSYQHPWMLYLQPAISHICNSFFRPFVMSLTDAPNQQSCMLNLHLHTCMYDTPDQYPKNSSCNILELNSRDNFLLRHSSKNNSRWKVFRNISANFS